MLKDHFCYLTDNSRLSVHLLLCNSVVPHLLCIVPFIDSLPTRVQEIIVTVPEGILSH